VENRLAVSPCSNPELPLEEALAAYSAMGYRKFEVFTSWAKSAFDYRGDPEPYLALGREYGMRFTSLHLPPVTEDYDASLAEARKAIEFAAAVGAGIVLYKAKTRDLYVRAAGAVLDAAERLGVTPVLQNHFGTAVQTLDDVREVLAGVADARLRSLLEVGHFHSAGVPWREALEALGGRIALVHVKDQVGRQSVPFGTGEIDLPGLFGELAAAGYEGDFVIEMEVTDRPNTLRYLREARQYVLGL